MIFVDSGYLIALLDRSDQHHAVARAWASIVTEEMVTTSFVLTEFFNYFSGGSLRAAAHQLVDLLQAKPEFISLSVDASLYDRGLALHRNRPDKSWSLTDCISFTAMGDRQIKEALAYDHHFEQAGYVPLLRRDPPRGRS
jgi:predicted nucleic acid-binding protein